MYLRFAPVALVSISAIPLFRFYSWQTNINSSAPTSSITSDDAPKKFTVSQEDYNILKEVKNRFNFRDNIEQKYGDSVDAYIKYFFNNLPEADEPGLYVYEYSGNWHKIFSVDFNANEYACHDRDAKRILEWYFERMVHRRLIELGFEIMHYDMRTKCVPSGIVGKTDVEIYILLTPIFYNNRKQFMKKFETAYPKK